jgi:hypothetical protein
VKRDNEMPTEPRGNRKIRNTHRTVETPKLRITLSGHVLDGPGCTKILIQIQFRGGIPDLGGLARIDVRGLQSIYR